jgi:hypothetical protein
MNLHPLLAGLRISPDCMLQNLDLVNKRGLVLRVNEAVYREASFLDDRMFKPNMEGYWFPLDAVMETVNGLSVPAPYYIFQVGHCGSTLISRLLAELPGNLPLREPMSLLALAMTRRELGRPSCWLSGPQWQRYFKLSTQALARTYHSDEHAVIKVTSTAGNLLEALFSESGSASKMLLMYINLESFLAVMLRTPSLRDSLRGDSPAWVGDFCRLTSRNDVPLAELSDAQQAAVKWLTLMLLFTRALNAAPAQVRLLNFDDFLNSPAEKLNDVAAHFQLECSAGQIGKLAAGPLMRSYSKMPAQSFNTSQRQQELREAHQRFREEIQAGLHWAEKLCREVPALEAATGYFPDNAQQT